jgi:hypothetical protein
VRDCAAPGMKRKPSHAHASEGRISVNARSVSVLAVSLLALAACDKPKPRGPAAAEQAAAPAATAPGASTTQPAPATPAWAGSMMGKNLKTVLPREGPCFGNLDVVEMRYNGGSPGTKFVGWGWDVEAKTPVARVLLVDVDLQIVGAGETGLTRPDVPLAKTEVTSQTTGYWAVTPLTTGGVNAYGIVKDGQGACPLGHLDF